MPGRIEKRGQNTYRLIVSAGYDPRTGKKLTIKETKHYPATWTEERQRKAAEADLAKLYAAKEEGKATSSTDPTVSEFAALWLKEIPKLKNLSPVTVMGYRRLLEGRIERELGHIRLKKLTPRHLTQFYQKLMDEAPQGHKSQRETLSASSIRHYHRCLRSMLTYAVKQGFIPFNPAQRAEVPANDAKKGRAAKPHEAFAILEALAEEPLQYQAEVVLALMGQLRRGEIAGLDWANVDFEKSEIHIVQEAVYVGKETGVVLKPPKTESGKRTIQLNTETMNLLARLRREQLERRLQLSETWVDSGACFVQWNGERVHPDTLSAWFAKFIKRHNLPHFRLHDLRHTGASILANAMNRPMAEVAERLGHASVATTIGFYCHSVTEQGKENAEQMAALIAQSGTKKAQ